MGLQMILLDFVDDVFVCLCWCGLLIVFVLCVVGLLVVVYEFVMLQQYGWLWFVIVGVFDDEFFGFVVCLMWCGSFMLLCYVVLYVGMFDKVLWCVLKFLCVVFDELYGEFVVVDGQVQIVLV